VGGLFLPVGVTDEIGASENGKQPNLSYIRILGSIATSTQRHITGPGESPFTDSGQRLMRLLIYPE
jgi:hypothetical protein